MSLAKRLQEFFLQHLTRGSRRNLSHDEFSSRDLQVFWPQAGMFGYSRQHSRSKFVAIVKGKYKIRPIETLHGSM